MSKSSKSSKSPKSSKASKASKATSFVETLTLPPGPVDLAAYDAGATPGIEPGTKAKDAKSAGKAALAALGPALSDLQERLHAEGLHGGRRSVLLVLQGMDTSGKGGVLSHVVALVDPQGVRITSFKAPTRAERRHDFLWRVERRVPRPGEIGVFDRSHYEDVLVARVHALRPRRELTSRYRTINEFEKRLVDDGTTVVKCMLHVSAAEQRTRLLARLDDPDKLWKFNPGDIDERQHWAAYRRAYELALEKTNTGHAPWLLVPSDHKWYRNLAIGHVLRETLAGLDLTWPGPDFDVAEQRRRLLEEDPIG